MIRAAGAEARTGLPVRPQAAGAMRRLRRGGVTYVEMLIVVSGEVAVVVNSREVARRREGDVVGEMAIITNQPRMATLVATGDVRLLTIGQRQFAGILRERPETSLAVMRVLARRLTEREASSVATS